MSPNGDMYLVGQLSTSVLTIRGGADVAEPFETTKPGELEPGTQRRALSDDHQQFPGHQTPPRERPPLLQPAHK